MIGKYPEYAAQFVNNGIGITVGLESIDACPAETLAEIISECSEYYSWSIPADAKAYYMIINMNISYEGETMIQPAAAVTVKVGNTWYVMDPDSCLPSCQYILLDLASLANPEMGGWG